MTTPLGSDPSKMGKLQGAAKKKKRAKRRGSVYLRGSIWWIKYTDPRTGKVVRESSHSTKDKVAVDLLDYRLTEIRKGQPGGSDIERTTLGDLREILFNKIAQNKLASGSRMKTSVRHLIVSDAPPLKRMGHRGKWTGFFNADDKAITITEDRLSAYIAHRFREGAANGTINRELAQLQRMFNLGRRAKKVGVMPNFDFLKESKAREGFFEWPDFQAVTSHMTQEIRAVSRAAYATGWRVKSQIQTRQWSHVDFGPERWPCKCIVDGRPVMREGSVRCGDCRKFRPGWLRLEAKDAKNENGLYFPLIPDLRAVLEEQWTLTQALEKEMGVKIPWVFHRRGKQIKSFRGEWLRCCRKAGVTRLPHDLRRTAVRNLERAGIPRSTAKMLVGHKTDSMYVRYAIVDPQALQRGGEGLAQMHDSQRGELVPAKVAPTVLNGEMAL